MNSKFLGQWFGIVILLSITSVGINAGLKKDFETATKFSEKVTNVLTKTKDFPWETVAKFFKTLGPALGLLGSSFALVFSVVTEFLRE